MDIVNLNEKKNQLLDKYRNLFIQRTGFTGNMLDNYVTNLIALGEKQYGSNFTEDILKEKREDSILWIMDEVLKRGGMVGATGINTMVKGTLQETAYAFAAVANQKAEQEQVNEKDQILELIDKMDEYEFEKYLKELSWKSSNLAKFEGIVSYQISQNPNMSEFQISKNVLKSMADEIELIMPNNKEEKNNTSSVDETLDGYVKVEAAKPNIEETPEQEVQKEDVNDSNINDVNVVPLNMIPESTLKPIQPLTDFNEIEENNQTVIPVTARVGKRKAAPKGLISKFKESWKNASFKKKLLIGAVAIGAVIGVGIVAATAISQMIATQSFDTSQIINTNNMINAALPLDNSVVDPNVTNTVDWGSIGAGTEVHTTLNDALTDTNTLTSNEWMNVDHMEAVNMAGDVINLDGMTVDQVNQTLDSGDYGVRGSSNGTYMGWFDEGTVKDAINTGKGL